MGSDGVKKLRFTWNRDLSELVRKAVPSRFINRLMLENSVSRETNEMGSDGVRELRFTWNGDLNELLLPSGQKPFLGDPLAD